METTQRFQLNDNINVYQCKSLCSTSTIHELDNTINKIDLPYFENKLVIFEKHGINIFDIVNNNLIVGWKCDNNLHICRSSYKIKYMFF